MFANTEVFDGHSKLFILAGFLMLGRNNGTVSPSEQW
jgi:hypothetical protein